MIIINLRGIPSFTKFINYSDTSKETDQISTSWLKRFAFIKAGLNATLFSGAGIALEILFNLIFRRF